MSIGNIVELTTKLKQKSKLYKDEGIEIVGIFGNYARGDYDEYSDVDIAYKIDYDKFFTKYKDGFSQILRLDDIRKELEKLLGKKVDFIPYKSDKIKEDEIAYV